MNLQHNVEFRNKNWNKPCVVQALPQCHPNIFFVMCNSVIHFASLHTREQTRAFS